MATVDLVEATKGTTVAEYGTIRDQVLKSVGLGTTEEQDTTCFIINPPSDSVEVYMKKVGATKKGLCLKPNPTGAIDLDSFPNDNFEVEVYSTSTDPPLLLHKFQIKKTDNDVDVHAVDLQATAIQTRFTKDDKPLVGAVVLGQFSDRNGRKCNLNGRTNNKGDITFVLPEGIIENLVARNGDIEVKKDGKITLPPPALTPANVPRKPRCIMIDLNSSSFSSAVAPEESDARVVVLGDVSGSMGAGTQMQVLRKAYQEILGKCQMNNWKVSLASWNTSQQWCTEASWIQPHQSETIKSWITSRCAGGGNDMRNAIEDCMRRYSDVTDVYVMCDGDITPFNAYQGEVNWGRFRARFPKTKFHFIALGNAASREPMEAMAATGGGIFKEMTYQN